MKGYKVVLQLENFPKNVCRALGREFWYEVGFTYENPHALRYLTMEFPPEPKQYKHSFVRKYPLEIDYSEYSLDQIEELVKKVKMHPADPDATFHSYISLRDALDARRCHHPKFQTYTKIAEVELEEGTYAMQKRMYSSVHVVRWFDCKKLTITKILTLEDIKERLEEVIDVDPVSKYWHHTIINELETQPHHNV